MSDKPKIVSSLTDEELIAASETVQWSCWLPGARAIANAAAQRAMEDLPIPEFAWFQVKDRHRYLYFGNPPRDVHERLSAVVSYIEDLQEGKL